MKKNKNSPKETSTSQKAPEMIPSMFNWITPDIQAIRAKHLDQATKK